MREQSQRANQTCKANLVESRGYHKGDDNVHFIGEGFSYQAVEAQTELTVTIEHTEEHFNLNTCSTLNFARHDSKVLALFGDNVDNYYKTAIGLPNPLPAIAAVSHRQHTAEFRATLAQITSQPIAANAAMAETSPLLTSGFYRNPRGATRLQGADEQRPENRENNNICCCPIL